MKKYYWICLPLLAVFLISCGGEEPDEEEGLNLSCGSPMPAGFQCIYANGLGAPSTYNIPEIIGTWDSQNFDFCVTYNSDGTGVIVYKASGLSPGSTQDIKWGALVNSEGVPTKSGVGTIYIVHESQNSEPVDPQITSLSFLQSTRQWYGFDLESVAECSAPAGDGTGQATFWVGSDLGCGYITVSISNQSGTITAFYDSSPDCGADGCANFILAAGNYSYTAECEDYTWGPTTITVEDGGCLTMELQ
jgi:hypothetical protein